MAALEPFQINVKASLTGFTTAISPLTASSTNATIASSTVGFFPSIMVVNIGTNTAYIRLDTETSPTATTSDCPMLGNTVRLFASPSPAGTVGVAVIATVSGGTVYFVPGQGGIGT